MFNGEKMKKNFVEIIKVIKKLNYILNKKQKKTAVVVFAVILLSAALELLGVTMILPFLQAIISPDKLMKYKIINFGGALLGDSGESNLLILMSVVLIFIYIVKNVVLIWAKYFQADYSTKIEKELSVRMLKSYMNRPYTFFLETNSSEILRGCNEDTNNVYWVLYYFLGIISEICTVLLIGAFLVKTDPFIAIGVSILLFVVFISILVLFKPYIKRAGIDSRIAGANRNKAIYQSVAGIKEIFVTQRKQFFLNECEVACEVMRKAKRLYNTLDGVPDRIIEGICVSGILGIVSFRLLLDNSAMIEFVPQLGTFAMAAFKIFPSIGKIASRMNTIIYNLPGLNNVYENILKAEQNVERQNELEKEYLNANQYDTECNKIVFRKQLTMKNVSWKYSSAEKTVLKNVCLTIERGQSVAFIGISGAGKTTLADVILGLLQPQQGEIDIDGIDIYSIPKQWAQMIGYVPQNIFLIDDTVRNNVVFGLSEEDRNDRNVWEALEKAHIADFIRSLPQGLDTIVGERGIKFSGGQRQRIAIARALYYKPQIIVFDEATAALDNDTESAVMESIESLQGEITMIIIAHRLSTIRNCDKIYEIGNGIARERAKEEILCE